MRKTVVLVLFIGALLLAFSCDLFNGDNDGSIDIVNVTPRALIASDGIDTAARTAAVGANDFAFRLGADLIKNNDGKNFVFSPYSVWLPLAALVNAAADEYKTALITALGASGITEEDMNRAASRMLYDLTDERNQGSEGYHNPLKIANAIFVDKKYTLRRDFAQAYMDFYRGSSIGVDFTTHDAVDAVNRWASRNTDGLITDLIQEFDPASVAAIANAIYFSDRWSWEFDAEETEEGLFYGPGGESSAFYMLHEGPNQSYYEDDKVQAISLGFKHSAGMTIILPKTGGAEALLSSMTNDYYTRIRGNFLRGEGKLLLPRFSIETDVEGLKDSLETLGVPLFEGGPITALIEEPYTQVLTDTIQRAVIKVDEKGTTAAAVTVLVMGNSASGPQPNVPFEMICNRPFMFILSDYTNDGGSQVLFAGIVNQP